MVVAFKLGRTHAVHALGRVCEAWVTPASHPGFFSGSCCDYRLPVCSPVSGHIGQRRILQETFVRGHIVMASVRRTDKQHQGQSSMEKDLVEKITVLFLLFFCNRLQLNSTQTLLVNI